MYVVYLELCRDGDAILCDPSYRRAVHIAPHGAAAPAHTRNQRPTVPNSGSYELVALDVGASIHRCSRRIQSDRSDALWRRVACGETSSWDLAHARRSRGFVAAAFEQR